MEVKLDTVIADVDGLKELTSLLKLRDEVSDEDFHNYSLVVDELEKKVRHIKRLIYRSSSGTQSYALPSIIPPTPPPSMRKSRP